MAGRSATASISTTALDLLEAATRQLLDRTGRDKSEIDNIVVVSTTGIATPSLDALLIERMGLRRTVRRLPIFGLGCAGGVIGLAHAASQAAVAPGETVLFLTVELCALAFRRDDWSKSNIVATALFGDGAAGALLSTDGEGPAIVASGEHTWPGSLDVMGWDVTDDGLSAIFSRDIPQLVTTQLRERRVGLSRPPSDSGSATSTASSATRAAPRWSRRSSAPSASGKVRWSKRGACCAITATCRRRP